MNLIYKIKRHWRTGRDSVVSELASRAGKKTGSLMLIALCGGLLVSHQVGASAVNGQFNYQTYIDFASNRGQFTPGARDIPFFAKNNTSATPNFIFKYPMPDFSMLDKNFQISTLVGSAYVASAKHVYYGIPASHMSGNTFAGGQPKLYNNLTFGDTTYFAVSVNPYENTQKSLELITPRLNKFVVDAAPAKLIPGSIFSGKSRDEINALLQDKTRFPVAVRTGTGIQRIYQQTINSSGNLRFYNVDADDAVVNTLFLGGLPAAVRYSKVVIPQAYVYPTGGIIDLTDTNTEPRNKFPGPNPDIGGRTPAPREQNTFLYRSSDPTPWLNEEPSVDLHYPYFNDVPYSWGEHGDSGSPLFVWDTVTQRWELVGVLSDLGRGAYDVQQSWSVIDKAILQTTFLKDTDIVDLDGRTANWNATTLFGSYPNAEDKPNASLPGEKSWSWHGTSLNTAMNLPVDASDARISKIQADLAKTKHISFTGGGTLLINQPLNQGAGGLFFDANQKYTFSGDGAWKGAGLDIGENTIVHWNINGFAGDDLHKIGQGTLEVNKPNAGGLKVGEGTVILNTANAFAQNIYLTSGRGTIKLNADNAVDANKLLFAVRGGTLDLNGHNIDFTGQAGAIGVTAISSIAAKDEGALITNSNDKSSIVNISSNNENYLYPGGFAGNLQINNKISGTFILNGHASAPAGSLTQNGGTLLFQGQPVLHYKINTANYDRLNEALAKNNTANENPGYKDVQDQFGYNLPDTIVNEQQSFDQPDWDTRLFHFKQLFLTDAQLKVARNAILQADLTLNNTPLTVGDETVYIDRNATLSYINRLVNGSSVASRETDQARYLGNITAVNSAVNLQNSQITASIQADANSPVTMNNARWQLTGNSAIDTLTLQNNAALWLSGAYFGLYNPASWQPHSLTVNTLISSNNNFQLAIDPQTRQSDKIIVNKEATGSNNILDLALFFDNTQDAGLLSDSSTGELVLASIKNNNPGFFTSQKVTVGLSDYRPNITPTTKDDGSVSWVLKSSEALPNAQPLAPKPAGELPSVPESKLPTEADLALALEDNLLNTQDTEAIHKQVAEEIRKREQEREAFNNTPAPEKIIGNFSVQDQAVRGSFLGLSANAKFIVSMADSGIKYILQDGDNYYLADPPQKLANGTYKLSYDSRNKTSEPDSRAGSVDIATGTTEMLRALLSDDHSGTAPGPETSPGEDKSPETPVGTGTTPPTSPASPTVPSETPSPATTEPGGGDQGSRDPAGQTARPLVSYFSRSDNVGLIEKVEMMMKTPQVSLIVESNQLDKRLGDIRHLQADTGVWLKSSGGVGRYDSLKMYHNTLQIGVDTKRGNHFYGVMASYTRGHSDDESLKESHTTAGAGLYYSWVPDNGLFVDVIGKYLKNRQQLQFPGTEIASQSPSSNMLMGSVQVGWHARGQSGAFIEPSVELLAARVSGYTTRDQNVKIELQSASPVYAKIGLAAGKQWQINPQQSITVAAGVFRLQNFRRNGDVKLYDRLNLNQPWQQRASNRADADNRYIGDISVFAQITPNTRLYLQGESNFGGRHYHDVSGQIGIRLQF